MTLSDTAKGPDWVVWIVLGLLFIMAIVLISGHGSWLISGFNVENDEKKVKYDEKKLCRVVGIGIALISSVILFLLLFESVLPVYFAEIALAVVILVCVGVVLAANKFCKK